MLAIIPTLLASGALFVLTAMFSAWRPVRRDNPYYV